MGRHSRTSTPAENVQAKKSPGKAAPRDFPWDGFAREQVLNYPLLLVVAACQLVTLLISWPVWNLRSSPPLLPLVPFFAVSFGLPLVGSVLATIAWPRMATIVHLSLLTLAIIADQTRLQPQVISLAVLMLGCLHERTANLARWYLAAMWFWAGLHKFLSAEWYGFQAWWFLNECGFSADQLHLPFAIFVATFETGLGLLAIVRPCWARWPAVALHLGLLLLLSPLVRNFNVSVWPWNIATAAAAFWILQRSSVVKAPVPARWLERLMGVLLLVSPALFYCNWLNPHLAFVLYSGNMPRAIHVKHDSYRHLDGWTGLTVPFPDSHRLFLQLFESTAQPGEKLHIADPRWGLPDRYVVMNDRGTAQELSRDQFWQSTNTGVTNEVRAIELEDVQLVWRLRQTGVIDKTQGWEIITSAKDWGQIGAPVSFADFTRLPNLQQLIVTRRTLNVGDLESLSPLKRLESLSLRGCDLRPTAFKELAALPALNCLHIFSTQLPGSGFREFVAQPRLLILELPQTSVTDDQLILFPHNSRLISLDLMQTRITAKGLSSMAPLLHCEWLNIATTSVDDSAIPALAKWPKLEVLIVGDTKITAAGKAKLQAALPEVRILDEAP